MALDLFQVLPATFIQESLATRIIYENLDALYKLDNEIRLTLLDLRRLNKLKLFHGIVYAFGSNEDGQLGTGDISHKDIPTPIDFSTIIDREGRRKNVIQVSAGEDHSLILCEDGTVYSFGWNRYGQLGNGTSGNTNNIAIPTPIDTTNIGSKKVIQVSAGHLHSLILCEDGTVYSFGLNNYSQLGTGDHSNKDIPTLIVTSNMLDIDGQAKRVIQVSAGSFHSLILCEDGTVYFFGEKHGQLVPSNPNGVKINTSNKRVIQVSTGLDHSLILCEDGTVYSFGWNYYGQLGTGKRNGVAGLREVNTTNIKGKKVIQVAAGYQHSLILCEDDTVYSFGLNNYGQLGTSNTDNVAIPIKINALNIGSKRVIQVSAGGGHSLILYEDGTVYSFGRNKFGQLGTGTSGSTNNRTIPTAINTSLMDGQVVIDISAGSKHSLILT